MEQSAADIHCAPSDFLDDKNKVVEHALLAGARKYLQEPIACHLVSYGNNVVASVKEEFWETAEAYIEKFEFYSCFEMPNMSCDEKFGL